MPLENVPTLKQVQDRMRTDIKSLLPTSDPWNQSGTINAEVVAFGARNFEQYKQLGIISDNRFITTATDPDSIVEAGNELGITLNPATGAEGIVIFTGTITTIIPQGTSVTNDGNTYQTENSITLSTTNINVTEITRNGSTATVNTTSDHGFGSGMEITISGAVETDYNGDFTITVIDADSFSYTVSGTPATPATGTISSSCDCASVNVVSDSTGLTQNVLAGDQLALANSISGVDSAVFTDYLGIDGGADQETIDELQARIIQAKQNPQTPFNKANIIKEAKEVTGVTRVFVYSPDDLNISYSPVSLVALNGFVTVTFSTTHGLFSGSLIEVQGANETDFNGEQIIIVLDSVTVAYYVNAISDATATGTILVNTQVFEKGQVGIYFVQDNDTNIIPSATDVNNVKSKVLEIKPADINGVNDVIVRAPTPKTQDFTITNLVPDTTGIRASIETNLEQAFTDNSLGQNMQESIYTLAIQFAFDNETGVRVESFDVDVTGDIEANFDEILILGQVTF